MEPADNELSLGPGEQILDYENDDDDLVGSTSHHVDDHEYDELDENSEERKNSRGSRRHYPDLIRMKSSRNRPCVQLKATAR